MSAKLSSPWRSKKARFTPLDPLLRSRQTRPIFKGMKLIVYGILFLIAASLVVGIVIGVVFRLLWLAAIATVFVLALSWIARKLQRSGGVERWRR